MEVRAFTKSARISPRKARLVADSIRNLHAGNAVDILTLTAKRAGLDILKTLESAMANAKVKGLGSDLYITKIEINEGPAFKRFMPSTRGRIHPYKKRTSHITIVLSDDKTKKGEAKAISNQPSATSAASK